MEKFRCVFCDSDNIQSVRGIFESGTVAEYKAKKKNPTISEVLTRGDDVIIHSQTRLAERLGNFGIQKTINFIEESLPYGSSNEDVKYKLLLREKEIERIDLPKIEKELESLSNEEYIKSLESTLMKLFIFGILSLLSFLLTYFISFFIQLFYFLSFLFGVVTFVYALNLPYCRRKKLAQKINKEKREKRVKRMKKLREEKANYEKELDNLRKRVSQITEETKKNIEEYNAKKQERIQKENSYIKIENEKKLKTWSNLLYCPRCDNVMDLEKKQYDKPENVKDLVYQIIADEEN